MRCAALFAIGLSLFCGPTVAGQSAPRIQESGFVEIGGIDQWVTIRGDDRRNPVLLLLHGGPGDVQSPLVASYLPYEKDFVLVQWDQRGSGKTFAKNGAAGVTHDRLVADGIELAERLRRRFPGSPLILFGHSWGSIFGTAMVRQRPDLFAAYVGTGQVTGWAATAQFQFDFLKRVYREKHDTAGLAALEAIGTPDPNDIDQYFRFSRPIRANMNPSDTAWLAGLASAYSANGEPEASLEAVGKGMAASGAALIGACVATDLPATATTFEVPYFVIQGRHDLFAPTPLVEAYFKRVSAPKKRLIIIEDAGHFALSSHQAQVVGALKSLLR